MRILTFLILLYSSFFAKEHFTISIVPQFPNTIIKSDWAPIVEELSRISGYEFTIKFYPSIPDFERGFINGEMDVAYVNPYHAVMANKAKKYVPILRSKKMLTGILVVKSDSEIRSVKQLDGEVIAFPAPNAFAASLWMRTLLAQEEKINIKPKYVKTHSNVYREVLLGRVIAGGGVNKTLKQEDMQVQNGLKILYQTKPIASHPVIVRPAIGTAAINKITNAFMQIQSTNPELLKNVELNDLINSNYKDYKFLEDSPVEKFVELKD